MKKVISVISLLLCAVLLFSSCGKVTSPENQPTEAPTDENGEEIIEEVKTEKTLLFNSSDGFNPFFAKSNENRYIFSMLYQSLFEIDSAYNPIPTVADSIVVNDNIATVKIKEKIACHGLPALTAADVVYSFNLAKASHLYSGELTTVLSASAVSEKTIDFVLSKPDIFVAGKLNFPIVKAGTADLPTDIPTGSGNYYFLENKLVNTTDGAKIIDICYVDTQEEARNALKIGAADVFFSDLSDCVFTATEGRIRDVLLNNMVFIGVNSANGALNKYVRSAIAMQINTDEIRNEAYEGHANCTKVPFNPAVYFGKKIYSPDLKGDSQLATEILDRCAFSRFVNGVRTNGAYTLSMSLIVNNDNRYRLAAAQKIAENLNEIGFAVRVEALPFEEYSQRIASGNFDLYLGEIKLDATQDLSPFFTEGTPFSMGIDQTERVAADYSRFRSGEMSPAEYYSEFKEFYPFIPIAFRLGYVVNSNDISFDLSRAPYNLYYNLS